MVKRLPTILFLSWSVLVTAQEIQWASKVLEFSSELTNLQYSSNQVLGEPNVLPAGGESPNAWTPKRVSRLEYIKVGFNNPGKIRQIAIGESFNPSSVKAIYLYDQEGNEYLVNTFQPRKIGQTGRLLTVFIDETAYNVSALKIECDGSPIGDYYSIDAIGVSNSMVPIEVIIDLPDSLSDQIVIERLSENVNSSYKEYKPLLSPDGKTLYFSRQNHPENIGGIDDDEDIWFSEYDTLTGDWMLAQNVGEGLNNAGPNYVSSISPDGNAMVLLLGNKYGKNGKMQSGVSTSRKTSEGWSDPVALEIENDYNYNEKANYFMTNNRKVLLLSVERDDSNGGRDLYASFLKPDSSWTEPKNLGNNVNTLGEESSPFLAADDKTLYFSTNGYSGYGGHDVYVTKRLDDTWLNWSDPQNMGPQINSQYEDLFFNIPVNSEYAYYSRGVDEEDTDIHRVKLPIYASPEKVIVVSGRLFHKVTGAPLKAQIVYERLPDQVELGFTESDASTGKYEFILPVGSQYQFRAKLDGFKSEVEKVDLSDAGIDYNAVDRDLFLTPLEEKVEIAVSNILFNYNQSKISENFYKALNELTNLLNKNTAIRIMVSGHTDDTGSDTYNKKLSQLRAQSVRDYLVAQGVDRSRIVIQYFGETTPIESNDTAEGRSKNRRVEIKMIAQTPE